MTIKNFIFDKSPPPRKNVKAIKMKNDRRFRSFIFSESKRQGDGLMPAYNPDERRSSFESGAT